MNSKVDILYYSSIILLVVFSIQIFILNTNEVLSKQMIENKETFVTIVGLPDLAISTQTSYIRHRSLTDTTTIFQDGPEHIEYAPATFSTSFR